MEIFEGLASSYERVLDMATLYQDRYWKAWVMEGIGAGGSHLVLDVGCGTLLLEERLVQHESGVVGIDLTEPMLRVGMRKNLPNVPLLVNGDAETLPFRDSSFDSVVSCYVAKYVDLGKFASELARGAEPGGRVVLYDFVRPRGPFMPFLALYVYGAMRVSGWLLGLARSESASTFKNLPRIVRGAVWESSIANAFAGQGVETISLRRLSGGVVAGYVGVKTREGAGNGASL